MLTLLEHFHTNLALEKDDELILLLGKMGAKTVTITERNTHSKIVAGSAKARIMAVDPELHSGFTKSMEAGRELTVSFEGNDVELDPNLLLTSLWFKNDSHLNTIFEGRRFAPSRMLSYTLRNRYTETFDFDFDIAAKYLVVKADLRAEYELISSKERFFEVKF
jgi:hypothetical protein